MRGRSGGPRSSRHSGRGPATSCTRSMRGCGQAGGAVIEQGADHLLLRQVGEILDRRSGRNLLGNVPAPPARARSMATAPANAEQGAHRARGRLLRAAARGRQDRRGRKDRRTGECLLRAAAGCRQFPPRQRLLRGVRSAMDRPYQRAVSLHRQFGALDHGRGDPEPARRGHASAPSAPAASPRARSIRTRIDLLKSLNYDTSRLALEILGRVRQARRARARFRVHRLRQRRRRSLPGLARPADDRALGRARSGRGDGHARPRSRSPSRTPIGCSTSASRFSPRCRSQSLDRLTLQKRLERDRPHGRARRPRPRARRDAASLGQRLLAEGLGTAFLLATVVGSGIMAERLAGGNVALALLVQHAGDRRDPGGADPDLRAGLGRAFQSGGEPGVRAARRTALARPRRSTSPRQIAGGVLGVWAAHLMFELPVLQISLKVRSGFGAMVRGGGRDLRPGADHPRLRARARRRRCPTRSGSTSPRPTGSPPRPRSPIRR